MLIVMVMLWAYVLAIATSGCATVPEVYRVYQIEAFTLVVGSQGYIQRMYEERSLGDDRDVGGFYDPSTRTIYVDGERHDRTIPKMYELGHEVTHLPELRGNWHD